jgi:hypothetical protein
MEYNIDKFKSFTTKVSHQRSGKSSFGGSLLIDFTNIISTTLIMKKLFFSGQSRFFPWAETLCPPLFLPSYSLHNSFRITILSRWLRVITNSTQ